MNKGIRNRIFYCLINKGIIPNRNISIKKAIKLFLLQEKIEIDKSKGIQKEIERIYLSGGLEAYKPPTNYFKARTKKAKDRRDVYNNYIKSADWRKKRNEAFICHGRICNKCQTQNNLEVHHKHYQNFMDEKMEDLLILCKRCHKQVHKN